MIEISVMWKSPFLNSHHYHRYNNLLSNCTSLYYTIWPWQVLLTMKPAAEAVQIVAACQVLHPTYGPIYTLHPIRCVFLHNEILTTYIRYICTEKLMQYHGINFKNVYFFISNYQTGECYYLSWRQYVPLYISTCVQPFNIGSNVLNT